MSPLPSDDRCALLKLARQAITSAVTLQPMPAIPTLLDTRIGSGAFVTLHQQGRLRGCIGLLESPANLAETVARCAALAAKEDPRFNPVTASEIADLEIEISVLSPLRAAKPEEVEPGTHGLRVRRGACSGVLLPQVASRYQWSRERFLEETCHKAGLAADAWRDPETLIEVFTAEILSETDLPAENRMPAS